MTNNDKALTDIKRAKDFIVSYGISGGLSDDVPSIEIAMVEMTLRELIDRALTPQSSADTPTPNTPSAEALETLKAMIERREDVGVQNKNGWFAKELNALKAGLDALEAQGRTQSAVPDMYTATSGDPYSGPLTTTDKEDADHWREQGMTVRAWYAAPPITPPIEKVDGLAEALAALSMSRKVQSGELHLCEKRVHVATTDNGTSYEYYVAAQTGERE